MASTGNDSGQGSAVAQRTIVGSVERLEEQAAKVVEQTGVLLSILGIPNEQPDGSVQAQPTITALDNRAQRIEEVSEQLNSVQERLEWATTEVGKV